MIPNVYVLLLVTALFLTIGAGIGKIPVWIPLLLTVTALLIQVVPR